MREYKKELERNDIQVDYFSLEARSDDKTYIEFLVEFLHEKKIDWSKKNLEQKQELIQNTLTRDHKFKTSILHMILGNFSLNEYQEYTSNTKENNKRIWKMFQQRLESQVIWITPVTEQTRCIFFLHRYCQRIPKSSNKPLQNTQHPDHFHLSIAV